MAVSPEVATLFLEELARRNIPVTVGEDGGYLTDLDGWKVTCHLDNISRDWERDRDPRRIIDFVESLTKLPRLPAWEEARPRIRWQAEAADNDSGDTFHDKVSDMVCLVLAYVTPDEAQILWLSPHLVQPWGKTRDELWSAAVANMTAILGDTQVTVEPIEEHRLGILNTKLTAFKAALLFAPGLKQVVEPVLGWPLYAVMPCRDFVYVLSQKDRDLLGRMGPVVVREYDKSSYPLSTEVFEITDQGIRAFAEFRKAPKAKAAEPEDGMKRSSPSGK